MITMFETLKREAGGYSGPMFLSSHPPTDERIANVRADLVKFPGYEKLKLDDGKLPIIQERLKLIIGVDRDEAGEDDEEGGSDDPE
jgi:predicted Zn-dependent protease